jgi:hypothetical protein
VAISREVTVHKRACTVTILALAALVSPVSVFAQKKRLTAKESKDHVGEVATVCGTVASARFADRTNGQPTFLNLDEPYPHQIFTIVIWGSDRAKFGAPEVQYRDKSVCATGLIKDYRGVPEMVVHNPAEIEPVSP